MLNSVQKCSVVLAVNNNDMLKAMEEQIKGAIKALPKKADQKVAKERVYAMVSLFTTAVSVEADLPYLSFNDMYDYFYNDLYDSYFGVTN